MWLCKPSRNKDHPLKEHGEAHQLAGAERPLCRVGRVRALQSVPARTDRVATSAVRRSAGRAAPASWWASLCSLRGWCVPALHPRVVVLSVMTAIATAVPLIKAEYAVLHHVNANAQGAIRHRSTTAGRCPHDDRAGYWPASLVLWAPGKAGDLKVAPVARGDCWHLHAIAEIQVGADQRQGGTIRAVGWPDGLPPVVGSKPQQVVHVARLPPLPPSCLATDAWTWRMLTGQVGVQTDYGQGHAAWKQAQAGRTRGKLVASRRSDRAQPPQTMDIACADFSRVVSISVFMLTREVIFLSTHGNLDSGGGPARIECGRTLHTL